MIDSAGVFDEIVNSRRSVRVYDVETEYDETAVERSLKRAVLAPNSSNMQLWEFYRVVSAEKKRTIAEACFNQSAARTANELVVVVVRRDKWRARKDFNLSKIANFNGDTTAVSAQRAVDYYKKLIPFIYTHDFLGIAGRVKQFLAFSLGLFRVMPRENTLADARIGAHKSAALAAMTFMYSVRAEGLDTCPLEGFDSKRVRKLLGLSRKAEINMVISVGKGLPEGVYNPRWRIDQNEVVFKV